MCSHTWPIKLILIEHKVVAMTVDNASDMNVAAKKLQPPKSNQFILESKWTFVLNMKKFPQGVPEISHSRE